MAEGDMGSFIFNGVDAISGDYLYPRMSTDEILASVAASTEEPTQRKLMPGIDPKNLSQTGWGVVFHCEEDSAIVEALAPLLEHRRRQAIARKERLFRIFSGETGYSAADKDVETFLTRREAMTGGVKPERMPYYLLLIGGPDRIPFALQLSLKVQYAVGRLSFDTPQEYAKYAESVVAAETGQVKRDRTLSFFGVRNPDDLATSMSADLLIRPLAERLEIVEDWQESPPWHLQTVLAGEATKKRLGGLLAASEESPALLLTASHGLGFSTPDVPLQREHQGALLCQDWPGPKAWTGNVNRSLYFSADDVPSDASVHGLIAFFFACYGAGTPAQEDFFNRESGVRKTLTSKPFVARLPQRLLSHPKGGALAVIGHVERAWPYSFLDSRNQPQLETFEATFRLLQEGFPVGHAMSWFSDRFAEISTDITELLQGGQPSEADRTRLASLWTANNDARNYAVLGDPAVRVIV